MAWPTTGEIVDGLHAALLADGTRAELLAHLATMDTDESLHIDEDAIRLGVGAAVPRTYVRLTEDRALPLARQDRFVADADAAFPDHPFDVHDLRSSHLHFQLHPEGLADVLTGG